MGLPAGSSSGLADDDRDEKSCRRQNRGGAALERICGGPCEVCSREWRVRLTPNRACAQEPTDHLPPILSQEWFWPRAAIAAAAGFRPPRARARSGLVV